MSEAKSDSTVLLAAVQEYITEYLDGYEVRGDEGDYTPNEREAFLIDDAIQGLLAEDEFLQKIKAWIDSRR